MTEDRLRLEADRKALDAERAQLTRDQDAFAQVKKNATPAAKVDVQPAAPVVVQSPEPKPAAAVPAAAAKVGPVPANPHRKG